MKRNKSIKFKAAFLLLVFGLNTAVGFACTLGLDMGFNTSHHPEKNTDPAIHVHADGKKHVHHKESAAPAVHVHADGKKHVHHKESPAPTVHVHADGKKHVHTAAPAMQQHDDEKVPGKEKDDCCKDDVLKFQNLDKNLAKKTNITIDAPAMLAILTVFFQFNISQGVATPLLPVVRYLFPPPPNILIAIHRFQI